MNATVEYPRARLRRLSLALGIIVLLGVTASPIARAQAVSAVQGPAALAAAPLAGTPGIADRDAAWREDLQEQLIALLGFEIPGLRAQALQNIVYLASQHGDAFDFRPAASKILGIYEDEDDDGFRIMALSALCAIGEDYALRVIEDGVDSERSPRVRQVTRHALKGYFEDGPASAPVTAQR